MIIGHLHEGGYENRFQGEEFGADVKVNVLM